jgi:hypothetical protein
MQPLEYVQEKTKAVIETMTEPFEGDELLTHMLTTYRTLRLGMGWLALLYPAVLIFAGIGLFGVALQPSISDYYFALPVTPPVCPVEPGNPCRPWPVEAQEASFPLRAIFCGGLWSIGVFLLLYRGLTQLENQLLNAAGLFAIGVAAFPMYRPPFNGTSFAAFGLVELPTSGVHFFCAAMLFVMMALVSAFCARHSLKYLADQTLKPGYVRTYNALAAAMAALVILGGGLALLISRGVIAPPIEAYILVIEIIGIVIFAIYWIIKSREIARHDPQRYRMPLPAGGMREAGPTAM